MRVGALASGGGTVLDAILAARVPVVAVIVDRPCPALDVARAHGVEAVAVERDGFGPDFDRIAYTSRVVDALVARDVDLVVMTGFGTILDQPVHTTYPGRVLNTHPALLPSFPGWHAVRDALDRGVKVTGCTVHLAELEVDQGPILAQAAVAVDSDDTVETLHERIKVVERELYPSTIQGVIDGRVALPVPA